MKTTEELIELLKTIEHPEQGRDIVSMDMVHGLTVDGQGAVRLTLRMTKPHDPVAGSLRRAVERVLADATGMAPTVIVSEPAPAGAARKTPQEKTPKTIRFTLAVASGKGGVGKSTVAANLAIALVEQGYRVGLLDADIYGPSAPKMFGLEYYKPVASGEEGASPETIAPALSHGVKVMSIGFFISPSDALIWRGPMATGALRQLIHQTDWGELDFLLIDLPPGTGDVHLTLVDEVKLSGALIVSTPQQVATLDVVRGIAMFRNQHVGVPIVGIVENMAWFTPAELPNNRYFIFGRGNVEAVARQEQIPLLARIPLVQSVAEGSDEGNPEPPLEPFRELAQKIAALLPAE